MEKKFDEDTKDFILNEVRKIISFVERSEGLLEVDKAGFIINIALSILANICFPLTPPNQKKNFIAWIGTSLDKSFDKIQQDMDQYED